MQARDYLGNSAPQDAIAGMYDVESGTFTGEWYYTAKEAQAAAKELYKMHLNGDDGDKFIAETHHIEFDDGRIIDHMTGGEWLPA